MRRALYGFGIWQGWTLLFTGLVVVLLGVWVEDPNKATLIAQLGGCAHLGFSWCTAPFWLAAWMALRSSRAGRHERIWPQSAALGAGLCGILGVWLVLINPTSGSGDYGFVFEWSEAAVFAAVASVMLLGAVGLGTLFGVRVARAEESRWAELSSG